MHCNQRGCPYPAAPGSEACAQHQDLTAPPGLGQSAPDAFAFNAGSGRWWKRIARVEREALPAQPSPAPARSTTRRPPPEPARAARLHTIYSRPGHRAPTQDVQHRPPQDQAGANTNGRPKRSKEKRRRDNSPPSPGQLRRAGELGIDPAGLARAQLQERIEEQERAKETVKVTGNG